MIRSLQRHGQRPTLLEPREGKDVSDHLAAGGSIEDLVEVDVAEALADESTGAQRAEPGASADGSPPARRVYAVDLRGLKPKATQWLWEGRIPLGSAALLAGRQGLGKSLLSIRLAALASRGRLAGDLYGSPAFTLIVSYEHAIETTILPRLVAAGADLDYVRPVKAETAEGYPDLVSLPRDIEWIAGLCEDHSARLLVVDPLMASLATGEIDSHRDQDVRRALGPLALLAEQRKLSALGLMHLTKRATEAVLARFSGSTAFTAAARAAYLFETPPDGSDEQPERALATAKNNLAAWAPTLACQVLGTTVPNDHGGRISTAEVKLGEEVDWTAHDLLAPARSADERTDLDLASEWLSEELADGEWHPSRDVKAAAREAEIALRTLQRARDSLGVEVDQRGFPRRTFWRLPTVAPRGAAGDTNGITAEASHRAKNPASTVQSRQAHALGSTGENSTGEGDDLGADQQAIFEQLRDEFGGGE